MRGDVVILVVHLQTATVEEAGESLRLRMEEV